MTLQGLVQPFIIIAVMALLAKPFGTYLYKVFEGGSTFLDPILGPLERFAYKISGIDPQREMRWTTYGLSLLAVNLVGFVILFILLRIQEFLPLNPAHQSAVPFWVTFNTAISFVTNTNWQVYSGETTMSYLSQMWLVSQQFISPAIGITFLLVLVRGFSRQESKTVGNFWRDLVRGILWVGLPLALVGSVVLVWLGSPQNFNPYVHATTLQGSHQVIAQGPVASMTSIMQLGDNGGGFFNMNAAHPYAAPNAASLMFQEILGFLIPVGVIYMFGKMINKKRQAWAIFIAMSAMFLIGSVALYHFEAAGNPIINHIGLATHGNMEGKEVRFGVGTTSLFENTTTAVSWGSVAASNDSLTPLGGLVTLFNINTGEVIFGSWGVGLMGMLGYVILAVFLAGLMVGRTPEFLGKKISAYEVKMASLFLLIPAFAILILTAISLTTHAGLSGIFNPGPHGLTEVAYAFSSGVANNGSAFGGLSSSSPWYSATVGLAMLIGRYPMYIPLLAVGGSLALKQRVPASAGTFPTEGPMFIGLLISTVVIVGALIFFPVYALGPIAEHFAMVAGKLF